MLKRNKISLKDVIKTEIKEAFKKLSIKELQKFFLKKALTRNHESCFDPACLLDPREVPNPDKMPKLNVKTAF